MSKGPWILVAGVILLVAGGALFLTFTFGIVGGFVPSFEEVPPGAYANTTVTLREGDSLTYFVSIENYTAGDELTVFLGLPDGTEEGRTTVLAEELTRTHQATATGEYTLVIQNAGTETVVVLSFAAPVDPLAGLWILVAMVSGLVGFVLLILGIVLTVTQRRSPT